PKITTKTLPEATRWEKYRAELAATGSQPITWKADNLPLGLTLEPKSGILSGTPAVSGSRLKFTVYASNPVKTVKKSLTLRVKLSSNSELPEDSAPDDNEAYSLIEHSIPQDELTLTNHNGANPDDCIIVAVLPEISADVSGIYDFGITVSDDVPEDSELIYLANSDQPSSDDEIAEFFDETGGEISLVPKSRKFTVSVWLNKGVIYSPRIAVRK
ncbi:MAG: putative Ig domain-containing protein, partial [Synergistaceae bacterium]|nr:putative Ig domain-containing protein [Synergistaceae bacterium]